MLRRGKAPYLECSSRGDKRFSAFYATVDGVSIERKYQAAKIFEDGSTGLPWGRAKGRKAVNAKEVRVLYDDLWAKYLEENPHLKKVLSEASGLSDVFGSEHSACQADTLWRLRNKV